MKLSGSRQLNATMGEVWAKLNDVEVLARCIPGCEKLERISDTELKALVALKIGPMSTKFTGDVTLSEMVPPHSYRISGTGKGGPAGMATGGANVKLAATDGGTELTYDVDANVSGKIAQLGQRLIDATAAQLAEKFFTNFAVEVETDPATLAADAAEGDATHGDKVEATAGAGATAPPRTGRPNAATVAAVHDPSKAAPMPFWVWALSTAAVVAVLFYFFRPS
jgi:uncharacterized protein